MKNFESLTAKVLFKEFKNSIDFLEDSKIDSPEHNQNLGTLVSLRLIVNSLFNIPITSSRIEVLKELDQIANPENYIK